MSHGEDLNMIQTFSEDDKDWEPIEKYAASTMQIWGTGARGFVQTGESGLEFIRKIQNSHFAPAPISIDDFAGFDPGFRVIYEWLHALRLLAI